MEVPEHLASRDWSGGVGPGAPCINSTLEMNGMFGLSGVLFKRNRMQHAAEPAAGRRYSQ